jgi:hypothetical protein
LDTPLIGGTSRTSVIDTLIELAERKIFRDFRGPANEEMAEVKFEDLTKLKPTEDPLIYSTNLISVPTDMLDLKALLFNGYPLTYMDPFNFGRKYAEIYDAPLDSPYVCPHFTREKSYFKVAGQIQVTIDNATAPTTYTHIPIAIHYYRDLSGMNEATDTNAVLQTNSDLYLFGALTEAEAYLVNDPRIMVWAAKYEEAMAKAKEYNHQIDFHAGPLIMGGG